MLTVRLLLPRKVPRVKLAPHGFTVNLANFPFDLHSFRVLFKSLTCVGLFQSMDHLVISLELFLYRGSRLEGPVSGFSSWDGYFKRDPLYFAKWMERIKAQLCAKRAGAHSANENFRQLRSTRTLSIRKSFCSKILIDVFPSVSAASCGRVYLL